LDEKAVDVWRALLNALPEHDHRDDDTSDSSHRKVHALTDVKLQPLDQVHMSSEETSDSFGPWLAFCSNASRASESTV